MDELKYITLGEFLGLTIAHDVAWWYDDIEVVREKIDQKINLVMKIKEEIENYVY